MHRNNSVIWMHYDYILFWANRKEAMEFSHGEKVIIIHFGELWLRGRNRNMYIKALFGNISRAMMGEDARLEKMYDRFVLRLGRKADLGSIGDKLDHTFGISNYEITYASSNSMDAIEKLAGKVLSETEKCSLKVSAHRSFKELPFDSAEVSSRIFALAKKMGFTMSNKEFSREIRINITKDNSFISMDRKRTHGGLPVGTSGTGIILLSGGIDSPVAAWYAMKRGVSPIYVHIHGYSNLEEARTSKITMILKELSKYSHGSVVYFVPSHIFEMSAMSSGKYELVLLKSFMLAVAQKIAKKEGANMIFTGESLGQVASQTPSNIAAESYGIETPILRPLIGFDKQEIISLARRIGTYEMSILPYKDVCSINARNPKTHTEIERLRRIKKEVKLGVAVTRTLKASAKVEL